MNLMLQLAAKLFFPYFLVKKMVRNSSPVTKAYFLFTHVELYFCFSATISSINLRVCSRFKKEDLSYNYSLSLASCFSALLISA